MRLSMNMRSMSCLLFLAGILLTAIGFVATSLWRDLPWNAAAQMFGVVLACLLFAWGLRLLLRCTLATAAVVIWLSALTYYVGWSAPASVLLVAVAALALGSVVVPVNIDARVPLSMIVGLGLLCGLDGWLLPFPIHYQITYQAALLLLIALRWRSLVELIRPASGSWRAAVDASPAAAVFTVMMLGAASLFAWFPTIHSDDLAYHLGLPTQLQHLGYYPMAAGSNVWAVSAWAADVLQGIVRMLAGADARGCVNMLWLLLAASLLWKLGQRLGMRSWLCWLLVALYASLPMTAIGIGGMQTEGATTALAIALALIIQSNPRGNGRLLLTAAVLFGLLLGLKVSNLTIAGPLGLWLLWRWRSSLPWRVAPLAVVLMLIVGGASYAYAYALTGNPVLPLFNGIFRSPYYGLYNFSNPVWSTGLHWNILWEMVFHTSKYAEGYDGAGGFVLVALFGALLAALLDRRTRPLALVGIIAFFLPLTQTQYLRYATPALGLMMPAMLAAIRVDNVGRGCLRTVAAMLVLLVVIDLAFVPNSNWQVRGGALEQLLTEGASAVVTQYAPERKIAEFVRIRYGTSARVLVVNQKACFGAPFGGQAFVRCWYDPRLQRLSKHADEDLSGLGWLNVFTRTGVNLLVLRNEDMSSALATAISRDGGARVYTVGGVELWELRPTVAGVSVPAPLRSVIVQFDTSSTPAGSTSLEAKVELSCTSSDVPVVMGWTVTVQGGKQVTRYKWASCSRSGDVRDAIHLEIPGKIAGLVVSAIPAKGKDLGLVLNSANASWRRDFMKERDLAAAMRENMWRAFADWIDPRTSEDGRFVGYALPSPAHSVIAEVDTSSFPTDAARIHATLTLKCNRQGVPIVLGWEIDEANDKPWTHYEWATCGNDGRAEASIDMLASRKVRRLKLTAIPKESVDMGLGLVSLRADYLCLAEERGIIYQKRLELAKWIAPGYDADESTP